jgi:hypothetical protein
LVAKKRSDSSGEYATNCASSVEIEAELALVDNPMRISGSPGSK